jgi:hypothetical protein
VGAAVLSGDLAVPHTIIAARRATPTFPWGAIKGASQFTLLFRVNRASNVPIRG